MSPDHLWFLLAVGGCAALVVWLCLHYFSREAKLKRRRRRNNAPVVARGRQPMVKLSVRTKRRRR